jgi:hypothetical protein
LPRLWNRNRTGTTRPPETPLWPLAVAPEANP